MCYSLYVNRARAIVVGPSLLVFAAIVASCREPTQVTVVFNTNACADRPDLGVVTGSLASETEARAKEGSLVATREGCTPGDSSMGTLVLARDSNDRGSLVAVLALRGKSPDSCLLDPKQLDCITARRRFAYISHTPLTMSVTLSLDCAGVACDAFSTCSLGTCKDSEVRCNDGSCIEPGADGGQPSSGDAGQLDGDIGASSSGGGASSSSGGGASSSGGGASSSSGGGSSSSGEPIRDSGLGFDGSI
jgi:uncharacterized membrane protein YgcG